MKMSPTQPKTITSNCFLLMNEDLINPFLYENNFNYLNNLFLRNKTFDFINCTEDVIKQCTLLIKTMDGKITNPNPDYYLTDKYNDDKIQNCVDVN